MKELTNQDIKDVSLDILNTIHSFCTKNNIQYSLGYGTLLGAIRHKGFIPWDDDVDVLMPRPDFEKFCKTYVDSNDYELINEDRGESFLAYARVCEKKKTRVETPAPWCKKKTGVWVDIMPIDGAFEDIKKQDEHYAKALSLYDLSIQGRFLYLYKESSFRKRLIYWAKRILGKDILTLVKEHRKVCSLVPLGSTGIVQDISCPVSRKKQAYSLSCIEEFVLLPFENKHFYCMKGYDEALRCWEGGYRQLPPAEKQVYAQSAHKYYWK